MKRHGTFYCRWCGYQCPAKAPVTEAQQDAGILDHQFEEIVRLEAPWREQ